MVAQLINGTIMAQEIRSEIGRKVAELRSRHEVVPGLAAILVGDDPASAIYVGLKEKACQEAGIYSEVFRLQGDASQDDLVSLIQSLNRDSRFHGILVQLPLPLHILYRDVVRAITPEKDIEGLHPLNMGRLVLGDPMFVPCAAASIQRMILASGHDPEGKHVVICGSSVSVGSPTAIILMQDKPGANATVTVCHEKTVNLASLTRQADILVSAVGIPGLITADMVKEGVVVIDVGTNRISDPSRKRGYRVVGDVDFEAVAQKAAAITPVPGGVGPMTIAMLLSNTLKAVQMAVEKTGASLPKAERV